MKRKNKTVWYCTGVHRDKKGEPCPSDFSHRFGYEPREVLPKSPSLLKKDWIFGNEADCKRMCDSLNRTIRRNMRKRGYAEFCDYLNSRDHELDTMLTVKDLVRFLKTQDQDALVVGWCANSGGYLSQFKDIPNDYVTTVGEFKAKERDRLKRAFRCSTTSETRKRVNDALKEMFRFVKDNDVIIQF